MIISWFISLLKRAITGHRCPSRLALAFSIGVYIAFCPFVFLHTFLTIFLAWAGNLNFAIMYLSSHLINNPWSMVAVYATDYYVGKTLLFALGIDCMALPNPAWMQWLNTHLTYYLGIPQISFWAFVLGGNVLGILGALLVYPILVRLFTRMLAVPSV